MSYILSGTLLLFKPDIFAAIKNSFKKNFASFLLWRKPVKKGCFIFAVFSKVSMTHIYEE